jgi:hypothetical protein
VTRILCGLQEESEVELDEAQPLSTRHFSIRKRLNGWVVEPRGRTSIPSFLDEATNSILLNARTVLEAQQLNDDDVIEAGTSFWVFHLGDVARTDPMELAALSGTATDASWQVLADWLQDKGDPLGERIARLRGTSEIQRALSDVESLDVFVETLQGGGLTTGDTVFRLERDEHHGTIRRLIARSLTVSDIDQVRIALGLRRSRYLQHLELDVVGEGLDEVRIQPWIRCFGVAYGIPPKGWIAPMLPRRLLDRCPNLEARPLLRWASQATLEVDRTDGTYRVHGIEEGERVPIRAGTVIEGHNQDLHLRVGAKGDGLNRHYSFELEDYRWFLRASDLNGSAASADWTTRAKQIAASIADRKVRRTPLLHGDLIEFAPGLVFRFRLDD